MEPVWNPRSHGSQNDDLTRGRPSRYIAQWGRSGMELLVLWIQAQASFRAKMVLHEGSVYT